MFTASLTKTVKQLVKSKNRCEYPSKLCLGSKHLARPLTVLPSLEVAEHAPAGELQRRANTRTLWAGTIHRS